MASGSMGKLLDLTWKIIDMFVNDFVLSCFQSSLLPAGGENAGSVTK